MRFPELSNYECVPGRAGGSPFGTSYTTCLEKTADG